MTCWNKLQVFFRFALFWQRTTIILDSNFQLLELNNESPYGTVSLSSWSMGENFPSKNWTIWGWCYINSLHGTNILHVILTCNVSDLECFWFGVLQEQPRQFLNCLTTTVNAAGKWYVQLQEIILSMGRSDSSLDAKSFTLTAPFSHSVLPTKTNLFACSLSACLNALHNPICTSGSVKE